jgi:hypothetical protein
LNTSPASEVAIRDTSANFLFSHEVRVGHEWMTTHVSAAFADEAGETLKVSLAINSSYGAFAWNFTPAKLAKKSDLATATATFLTSLDETALHRYFANGEQDVFDIDATRDALLPVLRSNLEGILDDEALEERMEELEEEFDTISQNEGESLQSYLVYQSRQFLEVLGDGYEIDLKYGLSRRSRSAQKLLEVLWRPYKLLLKDH